MARVARHFTLSRRGAIGPSPTAKAGEVSRHGHILDQQNEGYRGLGRIRKHSGGLFFRRIELALEADVCGPEHAG
jgi:hypothetical protein